MIILSEQGRTATAASSSLRRAKTLTDPVVEQAFLTVPRELFVAPPTRPSRDWRRSTATTPSSPGGTPGPADQLTSQPSIMAAIHAGCCGCGCVDKRLISSSSGLDRLESFDRIQR